MHSTGHVTIHPLKTQAFSMKPRTLQGNFAIQAREQTDGIAEHQNINPVNIRDTRPTFLGRSNACTYRDKLTVLARRLASGQILLQSAPTL